MKLFVTFLMITIIPQGLLANSGSLALSGVVSHRAEVQVSSATGSFSSLSSPGMKVEVRKYKAGSVITVSAP